MYETTGPAKVASGPQKVRRAIKDVVAGRRVALYATVLGAELALFFAALTLPIAPSQQQALQQQADNLRASTESLGPIQLFAAIFTNNLRVALLEALPVLGAILFVGVTLATGQLIQVAATASSFTGAEIGVGLIIASPFALVEFSAYAIAVGSGILLILGVFRRRARRELVLFGLEILLVALTLLVAAALETITILAPPPTSLALWLPTGVFLAAVATLARRFMG